jgi:ribonuclease HI
MIAEDPILLALAYKIYQTNVFGRKYHVNFSSRIDWFNPASVLSLNSVIYGTDGLLLNGQAGAGVYSDSQDFGEAFFAILAFLENCCNASYVTKQSVYTMIEEPCCWPYHHIRSSLFTVRLYWRPGHYDIHCNKKADELARTGSRLKFYGLEPCLPISTGVVQQNTKEWAIQAPLSKLDRSTWVQANQAMA